jgi:hypothetical protein
MNQKGAKRINRAAKNIEKLIFPLRREEKY